MKNEKCFDMVANAWSNITNTTLKRAGRKLLMHKIEEICEQERTVEADSEEAVTTLSKIPECDLQRRCNAMVSV